MAETAAQLETRLAQVREAITAALTAQSYSMAGRSVTRSNLAELRSLEKDLERKLARLTSGPIILSDFNDLDADLISGRF